MREQIREQLRQQAEEKYRDFSGALIPGAKPLLGVRLPILRKLAKEIVKGDWRAEIGDTEDQYFEETMLRGMVIGYGTAKAEYREGIPYVESFIPLVDNWSVCDSFCNSFLLAGRCREEVWEFLQRYLHSDREFEVRVALITLLSHYLKSDAQGRKGSRKRTVTMADVERAVSREEREQYPWLEKILEALNREYYQGYYAQMAAAWTMAEAFVVCPGAAMRLLERDCRMDSRTYNKALQKICESRIPDEEVKNRIRGLKR